MEDLRTGNHCNKCFYYDALYFKGTNKLKKAKVGYCKRDSKFVENGECCTSYSKRRPKNRNKAILRLYLCGMISDLRDLRLLMEEEERGDENEEL